MTLSMCISLFSLFVLISAELPQSLKLVHLIFRHGDNLPHQLYPTDPNPESSYKGHLDQLTKEGKIEMFKLGEFIRNRYTGFLSHRYVPKEIYVRTSETDETLTSALTLLAGLYPPEIDEMFNPNITWQPIPLHVVPEKEDLMLKPTIACEKYKMMLKHLDGSAIFQSKIQKHKNATDYILKMTGVNNTENLQTLLYVLETLVFQDDHKMQLDPWVNTTWGNYTTIQIAHKLYNAFYTTFTSGVARSLLAGHFLKELQSHWSKFKSLKVNPKQGVLPRKMHLYSTGAEVFGTLMSIFGAGINERYPFGSALLIELHEINDRLMAQFSLVEPPLDEPKLLTLPSCSPSCSIDSFKTLAAPYVTQNSLDCRVNVTFKQTVSKMTNSQKMNFVQRRVSNATPQVNSSWNVLSLLLQIFISLRIGNICL